MPDAIFRYEVPVDGQPLPEYPLKHIGSAVVAGGALLWHLMERNR